MAISLPIFLFSLPAGALGDIFDRRKLLLFIQTLAAIVMFVFAGLLWSGRSSPWGLLFFTFLSGTCAAFSNPVWQSIIPDLVDKDHLQPALALNGVSINIARALGPALGGFILAALGASITVLLNGVSFIFVVAALLWWHSPDIPFTLPREQMIGAMRAGVRFALSSISLRYTIIRALAFFIFASAYWALLPLVAKNLFVGGAGLYGLLLTALGGGAILGALLLPNIKARLNANQTVCFGTFGTSIAMMIFAFGISFTAGIVAGIIAGLSWIIVVSTLYQSAQMSLPDWVRSRGLAIFQMMFFGAMTIGSLLWGLMANSIGLRPTLNVAAFSAVLTLLFTWRFKLNLDEKKDHRPSSHWSPPQIVKPVSPDQGPVLVMIEYNIDEADSEKFAELMEEMGIIRRRDGAFQWEFFEDIEKPKHFIEIFMVESWVAHLRQHDRVSAADKALEDKIRALHKGKKLRITHAVRPS